MSDWQPIDTAPKEAWVLCCGKGWTYPIALMLTLTWHGSSNTPALEWRDDSGDSFQDYQPTHWMPIPALPSESVQP